MALTDFGALSDAQRIVWATEAFKQGRDQSFWFSKGFVKSGKMGSNSPIQLINELSETERGLQVVMQLVHDLQGHGVVGDNMLVGQEEVILNDVETITIDMLRNGVRRKGEMAEQSTVLRFRTHATDVLTNWLAQIMDELMFLTASGRAYSLSPDGVTRVTPLTSLRFAADVSAPTSARILYQGTATSEGTLTATDTMSWNFLVRSKAFAKRQRIKPIREGGQEHYAVVMSTEQMASLKQDPTYQTVLRSAGPRANSNPLFSGAVSVVDGLILHEHNKVFNTTGLASASKWGAGGLIDGAQALMMGAQAMGFAAIGKPNMVESGAEGSDYKNRPGIAFGRIFGLLKPTFRSQYNNMTRQDFGIISIKTAAPAVG